MSEFKDQLDPAEMERLEKLVKELRELAVQGQIGTDASINDNTIRQKIMETQNASLNLFQKVSRLLPVESRLTLTSFQVYEKRAAADSAGSEQSASEPEPESPPKEGKKD